MGYLEMLYNEAIKPYLDYLIELFQNLTPKIVIALVTMSAGLYELGSELFSTPKIWVVGISILVGFDFMAGTLRAISDPEIDFSMKRWTKTAFKIASFSIAIAAVVVGSNMFPRALGWLQYATYGLLAANEIYSILDNLKLTALAEVLYDMMLSRFSGRSINEVRDEVNRRAVENFKRKQGEYYRPFRAEEANSKKTIKEEDP